MNENKMRKEELELEYKINKIDNFLNGSANLELYIESIENSNIDVPSDIEDRILSKLKIKKTEHKKETEIKQFKSEIINITDKNKKEKIGKKHKYFDILKIAACTVFALFIWEVVFSKQEMYASNKDMKLDKNQEKVYERIENVTNKVSEFMMKPGTFERRDNK